MIAYIRLLTVITFALFALVNLHGKENYWRYDTLKSRWHQFTGWHFVETNHDNNWIPQDYCIQSNDTLLVIHRNPCNFKHDEQSCMRNRLLKWKPLLNNCITTLRNFKQYYHILYDNKDTSYFYDLITMNDIGYAYFVSDNTDSLWFATLLYDLKDTIKDSIDFGLANFRIYSPKIVVSGYYIGQTKKDFLQGLNLNQLKGDINKVYFYEIQENNICISTDDQNRIYLPCNNICYEGFCLEFRGDTIYKIADAEFHQNQYRISDCFFIKSMPSNPQRQQLIEESKKWYEGETSEFEPILDSQYRKEK